MGVWQPWPAAAASVALLAAAVAAAWGLHRTPDADCGCLGAIGRASISRTTIGRAAFLAGMAASATLGVGGWATAFDDVSLALVVLAEGVLLSFLSPELLSEVMGRLSKDRLRSCGARRFAPLRETLARLRSSEVWPLARAHLVDERPVDHWREGCWKFLCFEARYEGTPATAVVGLYLGGDFAPNTIVFIDQDRDRVLGKLSSHGCDDC